MLRRAWVLIILLLAWALPCQASSDDDFDIADVLMDEPHFPSVPPAKDARAVRSVLSPAHRTLTGFAGRRKVSLSLDILDAKALGRLLGPAQVVKWAENREQLQCYISARPPDDTAVYFLEYPELVFTVGLLADKRQLLQAPACLPSAAVHKGLHTPSGLRLGMSRAQVRAILGRPQWSGSNVDYYTAEHQLPPPPGQTYGHNDTRDLLFRYDAYGAVSLLRISWCNFD